MEKFPLGRNKEYDNFVAGFSKCHKWETVEEKVSQKEKIFIYQDRNWILQVTHIQNSKTIYMFLDGKIFVKTNYNNIY